MFLFYSAIFDLVVGDVGSGAACGAVCKLDRYPLFVLDVFKSRTGARVYIDRLSTGN